MLCARMTSLWLGTFGWFVKPALSAFFIVLVLTPIFRSLAIRWGVIDSPDGILKKHCQPTPYLGGVAFYSGCLLTSLVYLSFEKYLFILFCAFIVLVIGLLDDIWQLRPSEKVAGQLIVVLLLLRSDFGLSTCGHSLIGTMFFIIYMIGFINAVNLVDVMDGLAVTSCFCTLLGFLGYAFYFCQYDLAVFLVTILAGLAAFFIYNCPRATIYLGDAGSMLLGFFLAVIGLELEWSKLWIGPAYAYLVPFFLVGIFVLEVSGLVLIRTFKKIPFYKGSPDHFCHYLKLRRGWNEWQILGFTVLYSVLLCGTSVFLFLYQQNLNELFFVLVASLLTLFWMIVVFNNRS